MSDFIKIFRSQEEIEKLKNKIEEEEKLRENHEKELNRIKDLLSTIGNTFYSVIKELQVRESSLTKLYQ